MPLTIIDTTEDRDFVDGETIYDVDGNAYVYRASINSAVLRRSDRISYSLATQDERNCFTRTVPPVIRCWRCGITVFASSDNKTGLCTGCEKLHSSVVINAEQWAQTCERNG